MIALAQRATLNTLSVLWLAGVGLVLSGAIAVRLVQMGLEAAKREARP